MKTVLMIPVLLSMVIAAPSTSQIDSVSAQKTIDSLQVSTMKAAKSSVDSLAKLVRAGVQSSGVKTGKSKAAAEILEKDTASSAPVPAPVAPVSTPVPDSAVALIRVKQKPAAPVAVSEEVRNPFTAPGRVSNQKNAAPAGALVFGVSGNQNVRWDYIPRIMITGIMSVRGKQVACAFVEGIGNTIIQAGDRIIIPSGDQGEKKKSGWFLVTSIGKDRMQIQLDDGSVVSGRLF